MNYNNNYINYMAPVVTFVYIVWVFFDSYDYRKQIIENTIKENAPTKKLFERSFINYIAPASLLNTYHIRFNISQYIFMILSSALYFI